MSAIIERLTPDVMFAAIAILVAVAVLAGVYVLASMNLRERGHRRSRLERAVSRRRGPKQADEVVSLRRLDPSSRFDKIFGPLLPRPEKLRGRLRQTGRKISPGQFGLGILLTAVVTFGLMWRLGGMAPVTSLIIGIAAGLLLPNFFVSTLIRRRRDTFVDKLAEGIDVMVRGVKAGLPISETVIAVANEAKSPVKEIFAEVADRVRVGAQVDEAFAQAAENIDAPELKFLSITLSVQKETGGNLAETLENLAEILRKRRQMKLKIRAVSSEARASASILGSLPFVMFGILLLVNPGYATELFYDPRGHMLLVAGLGSIAIGIGVMMKMVRFEI